MRKTICAKLLLFALIFILCIPNLSSAANTSGQKLQDTYGTAGKADTDSENSDEILYIDVLKQYEKNQIPPAAQKIELPASAAYRTDGNNPKLEKNIDNVETAINWDDEAGSYSWDVDVPAGGLYKINVRYLPITENSTDISRSVLIDGAFPFEEAKNIGFRRAWVEDGPPKFKANADEMVPVLKQVQEWATTDIRDLNGIFVQPLLFYLKEGKRTISLENISGHMYIERLELSPPETNINYDDYIKSKNYPVYSGADIKLEGEAASLRNSRSMRRYNGYDASLSPYEIGKIRQNVIGCKSGNDELGWVFDVPEDGQYKLVLRVKQDFDFGLSVFRQILIDGASPFKEFDQYEIEYASSYKMETIGGDAPLLLNLSKGKHTVSLRSVAGEATPIIFSLKDLSSRLGKTLQDIMVITGSQPDVNFKYELDKGAPWIIEEIGKVAAGLREQAAALQAISGVESPTISSMKSTADDLKALAEHPGRIPKSLSTLSEAQGSLSSWFNFLQRSPLEIDYLLLTSPDAEPKNPKASFWTKFLSVIYDFMKSFSNDYNMAVSEGEEGVIDVWIARGREFGEQIQRMAEDSFTPETGINVRVNIIPLTRLGVIDDGSQLVLSLASGVAPDVLLGTGTSMMGDLALRGCAFDISQFEDCEEITKRFPKHSTTPMRINGGLYGIPDTMDMHFMFYRSDILSKLQITLPETWDELFSKTLPLLRQNQYEFFIAGASSNNTYQTFLFQSGAELFKPDHLDTTLDSEAAYSAFLKWTRAYTQYNLPQGASTGQGVFQHFRIGDYPIIIGNLANYLEIALGAPELNGRWEIASLPGTFREDGTVDHTAIGIVRPSMIFNYNNKADKAWRFLKWWTSDDVQIEYTNEMESRVSPFVWFSANITAFTNTARSPREKLVFEEGVKWYCSPPYILGSYMVERTISNAFIRTVMNNMDPRDSLEQAYKQNKEEIERKHREYENR